MKLIWDISNKCNLKCKYCCSNSINSNASLTPKEIVKIIDHLSGLVNEIDFFGGEPFLILNNPVIYKALKDKSISMTITTNGQFSEEILYSLIDSGVNLKHLIVSIDGDNFFNDYCRGQGSFFKALTFLKTALTLRDNRLLKTKISVETVVSKINMNNIIGICNDWIGLKVDSIILSPIWGSFEYDSYSDLLLSPEDKIDLYESLARYIAVNHFHDKIAIDIPSPLLAEYLNATFHTKFNVSKRECSAGTSAIYANYSGIVRPCRESQLVICDLKKDFLSDYMHKFNPFLSSKKYIKYAISCDCIYKDICEICCLKTSNSRIDLCEEINKRYDINYLISHRFFRLKQFAHLHVVQSNEYLISFTNTEIIEYEPIGYHILNTIIGTYMSCEAISKIVAIDKLLIFKFLIQEYSNNHVEMISKENL